MLGGLLRKYGSLGRLSDLRLHPGHKGRGLMFCDRFGVHHNAECLLRKLVPLFFHSKCVHTVRFRFDVKDIFPQRFCGEGYRHRRCTAPGGSSANQDEGTEGIRFH